jgi:hypothetical protein
MRELYVENTVSILECVLVRTSATKKKVYENRARLARKADNITSVCELVAWTMWEPRHLTTLQASTAFYGHSSLFFLFFLVRTANDDIAYKLRPTDI